MTTETATLGLPGVSEHDADEHRVEPLDLIRIAIVAVAAAATWAFAAVPDEVAFVFGAVVLAFGAWPVLREAVENLLERRMTMELSMTIALVAALLTGEVFVALVIAAFVLAAEVLETLAVARGRHAIADLLHYLPRTALVRRGKGTEEVALEDLRIGDLVLINPGGSIAVDGTVVAGSSYVDESTITGEPMPVAKAMDNSVFAGTVNQHGALEVRAERIGRDSTFGKIVEAVEHAERSRAPVQKTADRYAGYLVYFALGAAALTFLLTRDPVATISVVIVAGACGIAAGTPLAILGGIGRAAHHGSIIKGGLYLETLWAVDTVVLDKTGTLTYGMPVVSEVRPSHGVSTEALIRAAASAEMRSEHPLGRAIVEHAQGEGIPAVEPERFTASPGLGVQAWIDGAPVLAGTRSFLAEQGVEIGQVAALVDTTASEVLVARDGQLLGSILVGDQLREEAIASVAALRGLGIRTVLLTGDRPESAASVGRQLGVDDVAGGMLPEHKRDYVRGLVAEGRKVAMVGDGVNDAPALAEASVGVAMGSGTDVTRESAQIVLIGNDLSKFVETVLISRRTKRVITQNFVGTIGVDTLGIALAALGLLGPLLATLIHVVSELVFILNSARMLPAPGRLSKRR